MPYIKKELRDAFKMIHQSGLEPNIDSSGELNYELTQVCLRYLKQHGTCYATMNDIMGAVEGCKSELYRRIIAPYEDSKIKLNGDVYD